MSEAGKGSAVRRAMDAVTQHIRDHELRAGDTLPGERHFAAMIGVSHAVTREAFGALAALNRIDVGNGRKPKVAAIDESIIATSLDHAVSTAQISVAEIWDVRRTIECKTAQLAAASRTAADAARIIKIADSLAADVGDMDAMTRHDIEFHVAIAQASQNALFLQIVRAFGPLMEVAVPKAWKTRTTKEQRSMAIKRHKSIARAIFDGDPEAAARAMDSHFDTSVRAVLRRSD